MDRDRASDWRFHTRALLAQVAAILAALKAWEALSTGPRPPPALREDMEKARAALLDVLATLEQARRN